RSGAEAKTCWVNGRSTMPVLTITMTTPPTPEGSAWCCGTFWQRRAGQVNEYQTYPLQAGGGRNPGRHHRRARVSQSGSSFDISARENRTPNGLMRACGQGRLSRDRLRRERGTKHSPPPHLTVLAADASCR